LSRNYKKRKKKKEKKKRKKKKKKERKKESLHGYEFGPHNLRILSKTPNDVPNFDRSMGLDEDGFYFLRMSIFFLGKSTNISIVVRIMLCLEDNPSKRQASPSTCISKFLLPF